MAETRDNGYVHDKLLKKKKKKLAEDRPFFASR